MEQLLGSHAEASLLTEHETLHNWQFAKSIVVAAEQVAIQASLVLLIEHFDAHETQFALVYIHPDVE